MSETDLQIGGGYTYQWECAILLALNYFYEPVSYDSTLYGLITDFLGQVDEIHLEGEDREKEVDLEDINLYGGGRRILVQVKTMQAEEARWTPGKAPLLKSLNRFYSSQYLDDQPDDTRFVFLTNRPFNSTLVQLNKAIDEEALEESSEAQMLFEHLENYAKRKKKDALDVRESCWDDSEVIAQVAPGTRLEVVGSERDWKRNLWWHVIFEEMEGCVEDRLVRPVR